MAHILVVDDDSAIRMFLMEVLTHAGHFVTEAESGHIALQELATHSIDLIITDIFMPTMDGIDFLVAVLRTDPHKKIIAVSGGHTAIDHRSALELARSFGAMDSMEKPVPVHRLIRTIEQALQ
ncbi:MAG: response regulator [Magnetococcales bacterium]|nr:response regulator [Magnetococcales bacterium]